MAQHKHIIEEQPRRACLQGALAGFVATGPMTLFMLVMQRFLPKGHRYALPPEIITQELAHRTHVRWHMSKKQILAATLVSHFGYGAAMGALYGLLGKKVSLPTPVKGLLFGLGVWVGSYLGLLPLLGMSESGQREPVWRNRMMIAAHVVWGSTMGAVAEVLIGKRVSWRTIT
jgi:putative membrane protein